jgi:hypothetical protein
MSGSKIGTKRRLHEDIEYTHNSIKSLRIDDADRVFERSPSHESSTSGLLPPISDDEKDAQYASINPILREAHYLRQLRHSQRASETKIHRNDMEI